MKILIVTAWYHPFIHPRAHRWTALAEHWAGEGHEVHIVCGRMRGYPSESVLNGVYVHRKGFDSLKEVFYYFFSGKNARSRPNTGVELASLLTKASFFIYKKIWKRIHFPDDTGIWYFPACRKAKDIVQAHGIEAIVSVSFPFTGHLVGLALKKKYPQLRWSADTGDPFSIHDVPLYNEFFYGKTIRRLEKQVLQTADYVTVTSSALQGKYEQVFGTEVCRNVRVVPPLLHPVDDFFSPEIRPEWAIEKREGEIHLGYFGTFLPIIRTPYAFLNFLDQLQSDKPEVNNRLRIHIFGEVWPEFLPDMQRHSAIILYGLRSRAHARAVMSQMDVLLHVGNRTEYQLPSKSVDYLVSGLPVMHLSYVDDDPFVAFWGDLPGLIQMKVEGETVVVAEKTDWESFAHHATGREEMKKVRQASAGAYSVEVLGETFLRLLR